MLGFILFTIALLAGVAGVLVISPHKHEMRPEFVDKVAPRDVMGIVLVVAALIVAAGAGALK